MQRSVGTGNQGLLAELDNLVLVCRLELVDVAVALLLCLLLELGLVLVKDSLLGLLVRRQKANVVHLSPSSLREAPSRCKRPGNVTSR